MNYKVFDIGGSFITTFRIENAKWQHLHLLIYAHKVGVLNEKRCKIYDSNS